MIIPAEVFKILTPALAHTEMGKALLELLNGDDPASSGGSVYLQSDGGSWIFETKVTAGDASLGDLFGWSVALFNNTLAVGAIGHDNEARDAGLVYVYTLDNIGGWSLQSKLTAADANATDFFGSSVSLSDNVLAVGAKSDDSLTTSEGSVYLFHHDGDIWMQDAQLRASDASANDEFGSSVALDGVTLIVGSYGDDDGRTVNVGSVYFYRREEGIWVEKQKLMASDGGLQDYFGVSVSLYGGLLAVGAHADDDAGLNTGAVYFFGFATASSHAPSGGNPSAPPALFSQAHTKTRLPSIVPSHAPIESPSIYPSHALSELPSLDPSCVEQSSTNPAGTSSAWPSYSSNPPSLVPS